MSVGSSQLRTIGPWPAGINNLSDEASMPRNQARALPFLREATNVDLDPTGWPSRRLGYARVITGTRTHSAWSNPYFPWGVYVDAGTMHAVTPGLATNTTLATGLAAGLPVSYCRINGSAVWSNGTQRGQIDANLGLSDWACPSPNGQPTAVLGSGALDPGSYQIAVTFFDSHGRESGASLAVALDVPAAGAIVLTNIPQPLSSTLVPLIRIYATGGNDRDLKAVVTLPTGTTSYTIAQRPPLCGCACLPAMAMYWPNGKIRFPRPAPALPKKRAISFLSINFRSCKASTCLRGRFLLKSQLNCSKLLRSGKSARLILLSVALSRRLSSSAVSSSLNHCTSVGLFCLCKIFSNSIEAPGKCSFLN